MERSTAAIFAVRSIAIPNVEAEAAAAAAAFPIRLLFRLIVWLPVLSLVLVLCV